MKKFLWVAPVEGFPTARSLNIWTTIFTLNKIIKTSTGGKETGDRTRKNLLK